MVALAPMQEACPLCKTTNQVMLSISQLKDRLFTSLDQSQGEMPKISKNLIPNSQTGFCLYFEQIGG